MRSIVKVIVTVLLSPALAQAGPSITHMTGPAVPELAGFDNLMLQMLNQYSIPGGALAIAKDGRLIFARGYGFQDIERQIPVQPDSLFRIGNLSMPITAAAILKLVEKGSISLDDKVKNLLREYSAPFQLDARTSDVTVRHLLEHAGGWDSSVSGDRLFSATRTVDLQPILFTSDAYYLGLDFQPGTRFALSNLGYYLLGRIVGQVTGSSYEDYVRTNLLSPIGITRMRTARTQQELRYLGEVKYYDYSGAPTVRSVFDQFNPKQVPAPYGGFYIEPMASASGWISSTTDFLTLMDHLQRGGSSGIFPRSAWSSMLSRPNPPLSPPHSSSWYGFGLFVQDVGQGLGWWHQGSMPGTVAQFAHTPEGYSWVVAFNSRPNSAEFSNTVDTSLRNLVSHSGNKVLPAVVLDSSQTSVERQWYPTLAWRDALGGLVTNSWASSQPTRLGGLIAGQPAVAEDLTPQTFISVQDTFGAYWHILYDKVTQTAQWVRADGVFTSPPALTTDRTGNVWLLGRDHFSEYWMREYLPGVGYFEAFFPSTIQWWFRLNGELTYDTQLRFTGDPAIASCPDGSIIVIGSDQGSLWHSRQKDLVPLFIWHLGGGNVQGKPAVVCGTDNKGYVAVRDSSNSLWLATINLDDSWTWINVGGVTTHDPRIVSTGPNRTRSNAGYGIVQVFIRDAGGQIWTLTKNEATGAVSPWRSTHGVLKDFAAAATFGTVYLAGRDNTNRLWWYDDRSNVWTASTVIADNPIEMGPLGAPVNP